MIDGFPVWSLLFNYHAGTFTHIMSLTCTSLSVALSTPKILVNLCNKEAGPNTVILPAQQLKAPRESTYKSEDHIRHS